MPLCKENEHPYFYIRDKNLLGIDNRIEILADYRL